MWKYIQNRLGEHSTQLALGADVTLFLSALTGQVTWQTFTTTLVGSLLPIFIPNYPSS